MANNARSILDLERKYDFKSILEIKKNVKMNKEFLTKVNAELYNFIDATTDEIKNLNIQIDGKTETWYYSGEPTLNNAPANEWAEDEREKHLGDLYYDTDTGQTYRFAVQGSTYLWSKIINSDVIEALRLASDAQDTADGKRRIFTEQPPTPPYDEGDLWINNKEIYICQNSKESGNYSEGDFDVATKYTDDSSLNNFVNTTYAAAMNNLTNQIDGKVSTWYYSGEPTLTNAPANEWTENEDKLSHTGDLYYDKLTGYTYIFEYVNSIFKWTRVKDEDIVQAMSLANSAQDTADNKRRVFLVQPVPPYDNGDLWIRSNEIYICQISKAEGQQYQKNDFINNLKYTDDTVANAIVDELGGTTTTVLNGQVVLITNNFAKFTDLADPNSSTTIAGENIKTGSIKSNNYQQNVSGTKIDLTNGTIDTRNFKVDKYGNVNLCNGARVIGENGLMTTLIYSAKPRENGNTANIVGYYSDYSSYSDMKQKLCIDVLIPEGFEITNAKVVGYHTPVRWSGMDLTATWGYVRNLKLYKATNINNALVAENIDSGFGTPSSYTYEEISGALGSDGWTATTPNNTTHNTQKFESTDIKSIFQSNGSTVAGEYQIMVEAGESYNSSWTATQKASRTAYLPSVILVVEGYMTYS